MQPLAHRSQSFVVGSMHLLTCKSRIFVVGSILVCFSASHNPPHKLQRYRQRYQHFYAGKLFELREPVNMQGLKVFGLFRPLYALHLHTLIHSSASHIRPPITHQPPIGTVYSQQCFLHLQALQDTLLEPNYSRGVS